MYHAPLTKHDTLGGAIAAYQAGVAEYDAKAPADDSEADALAECTFAGPLEELATWERPAATVAEAIAALRVAVDELTTFESPPVAAAMVGAALRRLERLDMPDLGTQNSLSLMRMASTLSAAHEVVDLQSVAASHVEFLSPVEDWAERLSDFLREQMDQVAAEVSRRPLGDKDEQRTREITLGRMVGLINSEIGSPQ